MTVQHYDWSAYHSNVRPNKIAIRDLSNNQNLTYKELDDRANQLAHWLQANGVKKGDRIAILSQNCAEFFELEFACAKTGSVELPLNWRLTKPELEYILNDSTPHTLIYDESFSEIAIDLVKDCNIKCSLQIDKKDASSQYEQAIKDSDSDYEKVDCTQEDLIMIMYTSGTTGHPKGAMINHQMQLYNVINLASPAFVGPDTVQLVVLPLFHTGGMNCYANPVLHAGGEIILIREFDPGLALSILGNSDYGVSHFFAVPAPYQFVMNHPDFFKTDLSYEEVVKNVGSKTSITVLSAWYVRSFAGDYNPIHTHTECELTCVGFLKTPDFAKENKKKNSSSNGELQLISNGGGEARHFFENDSIRFIPKVGNWYLFPSNIRHLVYPFNCKGERRSFSINMNTNRFERPGEPSK